MDSKMSSLISFTDPTQAIILTDTLAVVGDKPYKFTSKVHILPHMNMIVAGTGVGGFADRWFLDINSKKTALDIDSLERGASGDLYALWIRYKRESLVLPGRDVTIFHFGFSEETGLMKTYVYHSWTGFKSEPTGYGLATRPRVDSSTCVVPTDGMKIMEMQRAAQLLLPKGERVYIGGSIQAHHLDGNGFHVYTLAKFDDFDSDLSKIRASQGK